MDASLTSLDLWQNALLGMALVLGLEAAYLLFVASRSARPLRERVLALAPTVVFGWVLLAARSVRAAHAYWQSYLAFQATHYDPNYIPFFNQRNQQDIAAALASASRVGWIAVGLMGAMLALGIVLLARWSGYRRGYGWPAQRRERAAATPAAIISPTGDESEITVEPLERPSSTP